MGAMTELLFLRDAYLREFEATVTAVDPEGQRIALDRTAFYYTGGGQPHDTGMLGSLSVLDVRKARDDGSDTVWHTVGGTPDDLPAVGDPIRGVLDWDRRHQLMRTHTALHILSAVVWRDHGAKVTGANMEPLRGRMDFELEGLTGELVAQIEQACNAEVAAARPIRVEFLAREQADADPDLIRNKVSLLPPSIRVVRVVTIDGLDRQADGGTHVADTAEVGRIALPSYKSKGRINKRIELVLEPPDGAS